MNYVKSKRYAYNEWYVEMPWDSLCKDRYRIYGTTGKHVIWFTPSPVVMELEFIAGYLERAEPGKEWLFKYE